MSSPGRLMTGFTLLAILTGCQPAVPKLSQPDKDAIKATSDRYVSAVLARDWDALGKTLSPKFVVSAANQIPLSEHDVYGRAVAVAFGESFPEVTKLSFRSDEIGGQRRPRIRPWPLYDGGHVAGRLADYRARCVPCGFSATGRRQMVVCCIDVSLD